MDEEGRPFFDFHEKLYRTVTENGRSEQSALDIFQLSNGAPNKVLNYHTIFQVISSITNTRPSRRDCLLNISMFILIFRLLKVTLFSDDRGLEIFVDLPSEKINHVGVHGEALYFEANRKVSHTPVD